MARVNGVWAEALEGRNRPEADFARLRLKGG
jgi:hypothetical protein